MGTSHHDLIPAIAYAAPACARRSAAKLRAGITEDNETTETPARHLDHLHFRQTTTTPANGSQIRYYGDSANYCESRLDDEPPPAFHLVANFDSRRRLVLRGTHAE